MNIWEVINGQAKKMSPTEVTPSASITTPVVLLLAKAVMETGIDAFPSVPFLRRSFHNTKSIYPQLYPAMRVILSTGWPCKVAAYKTLAGANGVAATFAFQSLQNHIPC